MSSSLIPRKAQIALEYLFIVGIVLLIVFFIVGKFAYERLAGDSRVIIAQRTVDVIVQTADDIYQLGRHNEKCFKIEIPKGVTHSQIGNGDVLLRLQTQGQTLDIVSHLQSHKNFFGVIPTRAGTHDICIEQITEIGSLLSPAAATCAAGDGCMIYCPSPDSDCADYANGYVPGTAPYCGNGIIEGNEQCETSGYCSDPALPYCNYLECTCYGPEGWHSAITVTHSGLSSDPLDWGQPLPSVPSPDTAQHSGDTGGDGSSC
ncbi:MAG: class III signal peptide-containing protein, partial [Nanoarchaeota archaeon]